VVSSAMARAVQTAELAAARLGGPHVWVEERLAEVGCGDLAGRPAAEQPFDPVLEAWAAGDLDVRVPGAESGREVATRLLAVLDELADTCRGETVLVIGHGAALLAVVISLGLQPERSFRIEPCDRFVLEGDSDGWRLLGGT